MSATVDIAVPLDAMDVKVLIEHLKARGFRVYGQFDDALADEDTGDIVDCLTNRGLIVLHEGGKHLASPEFAEAAWRFRRGQIDDALLWLERALPDDFSGLADAVARHFQRAA